MQTQRDVYRLLKRVYMSVKKKKERERKTLKAWKRKSCTEAPHVTGSMSQNSTTFKSTELFSHCL